MTDPTLVEVSDKIMAVGTGTGESKKEGLSGIGEPAGIDEELERTEVFVKVGDRRGRIVKRHWP